MNLYRNLYSLFLNVLFVPNHVDISCEKLSVLLISGKRSLLEGILLLLYFFYKLVLLELIYSLTASNVTSQIH